MPYTIVLSGPGGFTTQARRALVDAGLSVHDEPISHGLADKVDGTSDPTVGFLTCEGDDVDTAAQAVESLRWALRAHYPAVPTPESPEDVLRRIIRDEITKAGA